MAKKKISIQWHPNAFSNFQNLIEYIHSESISAANMVGISILYEIEKLIDFPKIHPLDRFKKKNDGNYRAFVIYNYRISYYYEEQNIFILRIRHSSREPLNY